MILILLSDFDSDSDDFDSDSENHFCRPAARENDSDSTQRL